MRDELIFEAEPFEVDTQFDLFEAHDPELLEGEASYEWMGEVGSSNADYVRWVQQSLNRVMGLQLKEDGISSPQTRSAVRSFQQKKGLVADGIVRPKTEAALINAGASPPPTGGGSIKPPSPGKPGTLTYNDVRTARIDVDAQRALLRMSAQGDIGARADARGLSEAVRDLRLTGIYVENQEVPARLATRLGTNWWKLIPGAENAALILEPGSTVSAPPTIAFRQKLRSQPQALEVALRKAWRTFQLLRTDKLVACPIKTDGTMAKTSSSRVPVSNLVPSILCMSGGGGDGGSCTIVPVTLAAPTLAALAPLPSLRRRHCCLISPIKMGGGNNIVDPSSLGKHGTSSEAVGLLYTGKAGFVDLGHMREHCDNTKFIFDQMVASGGTLSTVETLNGVATFRQCPVNSLQVARAISFDDGLAHEIITYDLRSMPGGHNSSFSPEDLCSNFLGTLLAERAIAAGGSFNSAVDTELSALLRSLDAQTPAETRKAFNLITGRWILRFPLVTMISPAYLRRRNFSQVPFKAGHSSDATTPSFVATPLPDFSSVYVYRHLEMERKFPRLIAKHVIPLKSVCELKKGVKERCFKPEIARIKAEAARTYGADFDKP